MNNNWSEKELDFLKENYKVMNNTQLASHLKRTIEAVKTQKKKLGLRTKKPNYTFDDVINAFENSKYELISNENDYVNCCVSSIKYICPDHKEKGIQYTSLYHFLEGKGCPECGKIKAGLARKKDLSNTDSYIDLCNKHGFIFNNINRHDGKIYIQFYCPNHIELGIQEMTPYNMNRDIKGCKYCAGKELPEWYVLKKAKEINPNIKLLEPYKNLTTSMNCICIKHNEKTRKTMQEILKGQGCKKCGVEKLSEQHMFLHSDVQSRINVYNPHIKLINYKGIRTLSDCYCERHNKSFQKYPDSLINKSSGCSECYKENVRKSQGLGIDEFKKRLKQIHPDIEVVGDYINNSTPIDLYCKKHNYSFALTPVAILDRFNCCDKSIVTYKQEKMCSLLESWGYKITRQKIYDDCKDKRLLQFDAYLDDFNVLIEYDGEQHFIPVSFGKQTKDDAIAKFEYTQFHDKIKNDYCKKNNISLIRVPYWEYENMDYYLFDKLAKLNVIEEF